MLCSLTSFTSFYVDQEGLSVEVVGINLDSQYLEQLSLLLFHFFILYNYVISYNLNFLFMYVLCDDQQGILYDQLKDSTTLPTLRS